ncbi:MORN repeat-containing protein [Roseateles albus]|uniref:MORN repeat-containing protein n=1 Tax=Roseateles albus TaxID=2987525 RepID=A0ABT5K8N7_9BURK|nr:hypothetical protein [Roseateles albus]MDC8770301.1 hypothetical protein [Roseateles albus]
MSVKEKMNGRWPASLGLILFLSGWAIGAHAQTAVQTAGQNAPQPLSASSAPSAASAPAVAPDAASAPAGLDSAEAAAPAPPSCSVLTQRAMSTELRAATALSQNKGVDETAKLFDRAIAQWTLALDGCEGRPRERAQKNLNDSERQRALLAERQAAGSQCEVSHRDAASLQELAARAFGERRWQDAASLYGKAETMWDLAAEHCTGAQQQIANKKREQAEIDAHNAEHCAPLFERAREYTQKFRAAAAGLTPTDKQQQSQSSETLWRKANAACKGNAQELAGNNAQAVARERGTPWVATQVAEAAPAPAAAPKPSPTPAPTAQGAASSKPNPATLVTATTAAAATVAAPSAVTAAAVGAAALAAVSPRPASAEQPQQQQQQAVPAASGSSSTNKSNAQELDVLTGDTRYKGLFTREEGQVVTGNGRVEWANGDVYIGDLLRSVRHGKGEFIWASGQRYSGDWVQNKATGTGKVVFTNGNQFEGTVIDGTPEGTGQLQYASGDVYKGQVQQGLPHGRGSFQWKGGQQFEGDWVRAVPQGKGVLRFANGNRYEGDIVAGQPQGQGLMQLSSGDRYEGMFHQGEPQGQGSYNWKAGERYVGAWVAGRKHGKGIFYWPNGDRWEGEFKDDLRTEFGEFIPKE